MFVALQRQKVGDDWLEPGDRVPVEEGRDYGLMQRLGLIAYNTPTEQNPGHADVRPATERRPKAKEGGSSKARGSAKEKAKPSAKRSDEVNVGDPPAGSTVETGASIRIGYDDGGAA